MKRPLTTRPLQLIQEIKLPVVGLSGGRNLIATIGPTNRKEGEFGYYSLPDCVHLTTQPVTDPAYSFDLRGIDDDTSVYHNLKTLYIKEDQYRFRFGLNGIFCYNLAEIDQADDGLDLHIFPDSMARGTQGWLYLLDGCNHHVYRLNIQTPTQLERLNLPPLDSEVQEIKACLNDNILILSGLGKRYRWNLDTQDVTSFSFNHDPGAFRTHLNPLTGTVYYSDVNNNIFCEDGQLILAGNKNNQLIHVMITLNGQMIVQTLIDGIVKSWLYG